MCDVKVNELCDWLFAVAEPATVVMCDASSEKSPNLGRLLKTTERVSRDIKVQI